MIEKPFAVLMALLCGRFAGGVEEFSSYLRADDVQPIIPEGHRRLRIQGGLKNEGSGCWGHCDRTPGNCTYCGTGQCCRAIDFVNRVPGCELAQNMGNAPKCGA